MNDCDMNATGRSTPSAVMWDNTVPSPYGEASQANLIGRVTVAEPRWPSGNTLAFNAEDPGSTPGIGVR